MDNAQSTEPRYWTTKRFAREHGLSDLTVRRMIKRGDLAAVRVGRSIRIPLSEVKRIAEGRAL